MAIYVAGDLQGCLRPLTAMLDKVDFNVDCDELWLVGDLVNRGPKSLATLRFLYQRRDNVRTVLGNHDLHLLAIAYGARDHSKADPLNKILKAPDRDILLEWLAAQPLLFTEGNHTVVHAGIAPSWSLEQAHAYACEIETAIQGRDAEVFFQTMYGNEPNLFNDDQTGMTRLRAITNVFTRMRFCTASGRLDLASKGALPSNPSLLNPTTGDYETVAPWYEHPHQLPPEHRVLFGHWAALEGNTSRSHAIALDTGCIWDGAMTLYDLTRDRFHRCPCKNGKVAR